MSPDLRPSPFDLNQPDGFMQVLYYCLGVPIIVLKLFSFSFFFLSENSNLIFDEDIVESKYEAFTISTNLMGFMKVLSYCHGVSIILYVKAFFFHFFSIRKFEPYI
jgi:hypothetical protein